MNSKFEVKNSEENRTSSNLTIKIFLSPKKVLVFLFTCIGVLAVANTVGIISRIGFGHDYCFGLVPLFDFDAEMNFPTFYSTITLVFTSILLFVIAYCQKVTNGRFKAWAGLALIFLYLSVDEFCSLHERLEAPVERFLHTYGFTEIANIFSFAWVIPFGVVVLVLGIAYLPFLFRLPRKIMIMFMVSGGIFVGGAIGVETLGGIQDRLHGAENLTYLLLAMTEESMEMTGIALFIYALLSYIKDYFAVASIGVAELEK